MKNKGFTIIEVLIALAIVGILAAVIVPAYTDPDYEKKHPGIAKKSQYVFCKDHEGEIHQAFGYKITVDDHVVTVHKKDGTEAMFVNMDCWTSEEDSTTAPEENQVTHG